MHRSTHTFSFFPRQLPRQVLTLCFAGLALASTTQAQDLLRVDNQIITSEQAEAANAAATNDPTVRQQVAEQLAQQTLLAATVHTVPKNISQRIEAAQINAKRQILAQLAVDTFLQEHPVTDKQVDAEYHKLLATLPKTQYWVRWIVVRTPEEAQTTLDALKSGTQGFAALAVAHSIGQNAELGGALGWQTEQTLPAAVLAVVRKLQTGSVAGPIALDSGYAIVQLVAQRPTPQPSLEQLKPQIELQLRNAAVQQYIQALAKSAKISRLTPQQVPHSATPQNTEADHAQP